MVVNGTAVVKNYIVQNAANVGSGNGTSGAGNGQSGPGKGNATVSASGYPVPSPTGISGGASLRGQMSVLGMVVAVVLGVVVVL